MKNLRNYLFLLVLLLTFSCNNNEYEYPNVDLTVDELFSYCSIDGKHPCNKSLNNEGEFVTVIGYYRITSHGDYLKGNKFRFFDSPTIGSINTEITILQNSLSVFDKISGFIRENSVGEYVKLKVSGTIVGQDLPTNGACSRGVFLEIDGSSAVRLD